MRHLSFPTIGPLGLLSACVVCALVVLVAAASAAQDDVPTSAPLGNQAGIQAEAQSQTILQQAVEIFLHLDRSLGNVIAEYGTLTYLILFGIIFLETGFVVTPFLPGDSLLFAAGTFCALGQLNLALVLALLASAAILGDNSNYWVGRFLGPRIFRGENVRFLNRKHLDRTHEFFERYGVKAIILARFVPIVRTFTPFVAGMGRMNYLTFISFDVAGGIFWVSSLSLCGYFFGAIPVVKKNFTLAILAIVFISILPAIIEAIRAKCEAAKRRNAGSAA